ncbi:uncharacterized protein DNG_00455 [Cephalotrichum gorgonifer]|uniref:Uncharacterized protein n=1 Tax=Cephalotrichum gorgonifer TaxID=2041049 RepID=A0AAE8SR81_9PEZI|nr:uncharacterized protein DNG_00455 [Cephalotrichum gorgonifer]
MAPTLHRRADADLKTWLIVVVAVASVIVTSLVIYLIVTRFQNKQYREAAKRDPYLTRKEWARRRKLSSLQRIEEEEAQRQHIIRKTLSSLTASGEFEHVEGHRAPSSTEEPRKEEGAANREAAGEDWKRWEAGYGVEPENEGGEAHPLMEEHPAVKADATPPRGRSADPASMPLLLVQDPEESRQEPEERRTSLWERRTSEDNHASHTRSPSPSSQRASRSPTPTRNQPEQPHISHPPVQLLRISSPIGQPRVVDVVQNQSTPNRSRATSVDSRQHTPSHVADIVQNQPTPHRPRATSTDSRQHTRHRSSSSSSFRIRAPSNPPTGPLPQLPTSVRSRSSSTSSQALAPNLISLPPPAALAYAASPRESGFLAPEPEPPLITAAARRDTSPSWEQPRPTMQARARSHDALVEHRRSSPSPGHSVQRKPLPTTALRGRLSVGSLATVGGAGAAFVPPAVSPVEEASPESERTPVSPFGDTIMVAGAASVAALIAGAKMCDRDILPSQIHPALREDHQRRPSPVRQVNITPTPTTEYGSYSAHPEGYTAEPEEDPSAFSFERGATLEHFGVSLRDSAGPDRLSGSHTHLAVPTLQRHASVKSTASMEDEEGVPTAFSFEEGASLKELGISIRNPPPREDRPSLTADVRSPSPPLQYPRHTVPAVKQGAETPLSFEEESQLKELGFSQPQAPTQPKRRSSPMTQNPSHLPVSHPNRDRSRSLENQMQDRSRAELTPEDIAKRLRSRSFDNRGPTPPQGGWQLQVSMLDQTGARNSRSHSRASGEEDGEEEDGRRDSEYYSSASEPASPDGYDTFDAEIPPPPGKFSTNEAGPHNPRGDHTSANSSPAMGHTRSASTPMTSPDLELAALCRANFASPVREKFLAETLRSPPPNGPPHRTPPLFHSPSPTSPPAWPRAQAFGSPDLVSPWSPTSPEPRVHGTVEGQYGRDTMKVAVGAPVGGRTKRKGDVSFRLSGPPDLMPAFF